MFNKLKQKLQNFVEEEKKVEIKPKASLETKIKKKVKRKAQIKEKDITELLENLELSLLSVDVSLELTEKLKENIKQELVGKEVKAAEDLAEITLKTIKETLTQELIQPKNYLVEEVKEKNEETEEPYVILFVGPNGHGKTTTIAKVSHMLQKEGTGTVLAAADTFRAASIEQLEKWAQKLDTKLIKQGYGADPAAVCYDAKKHAQSSNKGAVLIDTAGRSELDKNLMNQLEKIKKVVQPDKTIYITEAVAGNAAVHQANEFNKKIGLDGFIMTKVDTDAKGGCILSISSKVKKPIYYIGTGQNPEDLKKFEKQWFIEKILPRN